MALVRDGRLRPILRILLYIVGVLGVLWLSAIVTFAIHGSPPRGVGLNRLAPYLFFDLALSTAAFTAMTFAFRRYVDRREIASLGFSFRAPWLRLTATGAAFGAGMQCAVFLMDRLLGYSTVTPLRSGGAMLRELPLFLIYLMIAAFFEELCFRGYILQNLWEEWGFAPAAAIAGVLFALPHLSNPHSRVQLSLTLAGLLAYGTWAALSVLWTKSVWLAFGAHFAWNFFEGPVFGFPLSGANLSGHTLFTQAVRGPDWFTGGAYGPEAGASAIIALALGLAALYWLARAGVFMRAPDSRESYARSAV